MSQMFQDVLSQITSLWKGLGLSQRIAVAIVGVLAIALIAAVTTWARTPEYAVAYTNLSEEDAAAVVAKLKETKTPYELADGGSAIRVPASTLYDTRLQIASSGLPQGGSVGFELFSQANFGMTDFAQKVNYQRALEGELSRTINKLGPVEQSRVHIVIPQPSLYIDNQKEASASVVLQLRRGQRLSPAQIEGITHLVSSSVEGLKPKGLTIVDAGGNILSNAQSAANDPQKASATLLEAQRVFETELEQKAQAMLDKVLGFGKANVQVNASMDWDQFESNSEIYSPVDYKPQVRSSRLITEWQDGGQSQGGIPGVATNIPGYAGVISGTGEARGQTGKQDATVNYELSKTTERVTRTPGRIKKLSVAVVLDGSEPLEQERIESISRLVSAAVGVDTTRGDSLEVSSIPFDRSAFAEDARGLEEAQRREDFLQNAKLGAMALGPVLLLLAIFILLRRGQPRPITRVREVNAPRPQLAGPHAGSATDGGRAAPRGLPQPAMPALGLPARATETNRAMLEVTLLAKQQPQVMAQLIKTWLEEDSTK